LKRQRLSSNENRLALAGTVWLASDIHLGPEVPLTASVFQRFLDEASVQADALILCGDIFDAWIGDDAALDAHAPWLEQAMLGMRKVSSQVPLWLGRGNRDFLLGRQFASAVGASMLPDSVLLDTDAGQVLLSHGDEYCTDDAGYQRFRRIVRQPLVQGIFLSLSLGTRRRIANWARARSKASNQYKAVDIMDVTPSAVTQALARSGASTMVHGHTHRPAIHELEAGGTQRRRIVLPDWDFDHAQPPRGGWLSISSDGMRLQEAAVLLKGQPAPHSQP